MMQLVKWQRPISLFVFWFPLTKKFYGMRRQGAILIGITSFNLYLMISKTIQYDQNLRSRQFCPLNQSMSELFFSLVDYRNNYFTSDDLNKIIEFYNGFENRDQLIQWMKERPNGIANIHEVEGDKDIIVVIPTADFNGKYAKECRDNIFKGLHIIFVESGEVPDPYFNYAHNCNVGVRRAIEHNPKWVVVSGDDMIKIDDVSKLKEELKNIDNNETKYVAITPSSYHSQTTLIGKKTLLYNLFFFLQNGREGKTRVNLKDRFSVTLERIPNTVISRLLVRNAIKITENGDFGIYSRELISTYHGNIFDEVFINAFEETELATRIYWDNFKWRRIGFSIGEYYGATLSTGLNRVLREITGQIYISEKWGEVLRPRK